MATVPLDTPTYPLAPIEYTSSIGLTITRGGFPAVLDTPFTQYAGAPVERAKAFTWDSGTGTENPPAPARYIVYLTIDGVPGVWAWCYPGDLKIVACEMILSGATIGGIDYLTDTTGTVLWFGGQ